MNLYELNPVLLNVLDSSKTKSLEGAEIQLSSGITRKNAERLFRVIIDNKPENVLEIGMAHGISSAAIVTALNQFDKGTLLSIDPYQFESWQGAGLALVARSGHGGRHRHINQPDYFALPKLLKDNYVCDVAYVDGMHSFEYTFLDFFYIDRLLGVGGLIGFNDCGMPAVEKVINYIDTHAHYVEEYLEPVSWFQKRHLKYWEYPDRWFRKNKSHTVAWDFYKEF